MKKLLITIIVFVILAALSYGLYVERETLLKKEEESKVVVQPPKDKNKEEPKKEQKEPPIDEKAYSAAMLKAFNYKSVGDAGNVASYQKAITEYKKAADISRNTVWMPFLNLGNTYRIIKDYKNAESAYDKAQGIEPSEGSIFAAKIDLYRYDMKKSAEEIMKLYDVAIAKVVANANLVVSYAGYVDEIGRYAEALKWYNVLYERYPENQTYKQKVEELNGKVTSVE